MCAFSLIRDFFELEMAISALHIQAKTKQLNVCLKDLNTVSFVNA